MEKEFHIEDQGPINGTIVEESKWSKFKNKWFSKQGMTGFLVISLLGAGFYQIINWIIEIIKYIF